jgi:tripartite-type tricarboxylate transporter receptor subunit TctC
MIGSFANSLLVRADHPAKSFQEFINLARQKPGKLTFASAGPGSAGHLTGELLKIRAAIDIQHVPYKGTGPAIVDLISGQIDALFDGLPASIGYIRSGKLRALAISSAQRLPALPSVPTINETVPGVVGTAWFGISAPVRTPQTNIETLQDAVQRSLLMPDLKARYAEIGVVVSGQGQREYTAFIEQEIAQWGPVIKAANVKAE